MRTLNVLLSCCPLVLAVMTPAAAEPVDRGQCSATESNVAHKIGGKNYSCDKTVCTKCTLGDPPVCTKTTYYDNCVAALSGGSNLQIPTTGGMKLPPDQPRKFPTPPATGVLEPTTGLPPQGPAPSGPRGTRGGTDTLQ
jgi:hypothetical protein